MAGAERRQGTRAAGQSPREDRWWSKARSQNAPEGSGVGLRCDREPQDRARDVGRGSGGLDDFSDPVSGRALASRGTTRACQDGARALVTSLWSGLSRAGAVRTLAALPVAARGYRVAVARAVVAAVLHERRTADSPATLPTGVAFQSFPKNTFFICLRGGGLK